MVIIAQYEECSRNHYVLEAGEIYVMCQGGQTDMLYVEQAQGVTSSAELLCYVNFSSKFKYLFFYLCVCLSNFECYVFTCSKRPQALRFPETGITGS